MRLYSARVDHRHHQRILARGEVPGRRQIDTAATILEIPLGRKRGIGGHGERIPTTLRIGVLDLGKFANPGGDFFRIRLSH